MGLFEKARQIGFCGIGLSQRGDHDHKFIHIDTLGRKDLWFSQFPVLEHASRFTLGEFTVTYSTFRQGW